MLFVFFKPDQAIQESCNRCDNVSKSYSQHEYTVSTKKKSPTFVTVVVSLTCPVGISTFSKSHLLLDCYISLKVESLKSNCCLCSDTLMPPLRTCRLLTTSASFVGRRWSPEPRSCHVITSFTPGGLDFRAGFKLNSVNIWMFAVIKCRVNRNPVLRQRRKRSWLLFLSFCSCLRSWFQRQQTCPTCRMDVLRATNNNQTPAPAQAPPPAPAAPANAAANAAPPNGEFPDLFTSTRRPCFYCGLFISSEGLGSLFWWIQLRKKKFIILWLCIRLKI